MPLNAVKDLLYRSPAPLRAAPRRGRFTRQLNYLSGNPSNFYIFPETGFSLVTPAPVPTPVAPYHRRARVVPRARSKAQAESFYLAAYHLK